MTDAPPSAAQIDAFVGRWRAAGGTERANYQIGVDAITAAFTGRGPWKRRIPQILEALAALGRARGSTACGRRGDDRQRAERASGRILTL